MCGEGIIHTLRYSSGSRFRLPVFMELQRWWREPFCSCFLYYACDGGAADLERLCDLTKRVSVSAVAKDGGPVEFECGAPDVATFEPGSAHAGTDPFDDQAALQFGHDADDDDDGAAERTAGVDLLAEADELDAEPVHFVQHFEEMLDGPGDAIACPDQNHIELSAAGIGSS